MADQPEPTRLTEEQARAGATPRVTRYVLVVSLALVVAIFAAMLLLR